MQRLVDLRVEEISSINLNFNSSIRARLVD